MLTYPAGLPIVERREEILAAIGDHQVVIVAGETGSGKSTQLPKMCLELDRGGDGRMIGHTQPRRIAARTLAERVAEELGGAVGDVVGYQVRFTDRVGEATRVKLMTDGILLAEIQRDRNLRRYDTLIVDEAHERSLNVDFILGYLKQLLPRRPDLKVVVTSATIDTVRFSQHFDGAPVVEVSGRSFPVEVRYQPLDDGGADRDQVQAICDAVEELAAEGPGDVLVFLSGEREIRDTADALRRLDLPDVELLPLYARLSAAEQHRVFKPHGGRRVVLATNVAETSLTVPGVRYVVDPGTARISRYNRRTKVQRLPIEPVSQASANQRAGRCGRVAPGICIRLYSEDDFAGRPEFTEPEILRTNLASVILQMTALNLGDVVAFPFVDPPDARNVKDGIALLEELGALDGPQRLTKLGRRLAQIPLDPRLGRMVLEAERYACVREVMVIAAALSIQDPRERPAAQQQAAAEHHARFVDRDSDFVTLLNLWAYLQEQQAALSSSQFRKLCRAEFLNYLRVREWRDIYSQLRQVVRTLGITVNHDPAPRDAVHRSLLSGLLSHVGALQEERHEYVGARNARFAIAPGSPLSRRPPRWVMAAELVETNRLWARVVARVQPEWAEQAGAHLVKRSHGDAWWDARRGAAMVNERVTLFGLPIVGARRVPLARVDAAAARDLFIANALVDGDWDTHHEFLRENRKLVEEVRALEDRARRRIMVDDDVLFGFYDERLPADVVSARHFDQWWKKQRQRDAKLLSFTMEVLVRDDAAEVSAAAYPDTWAVRDLSLPVTYEFDPASDTDGVVVHVPLSVLNRVDAADFEWQVPGLREELVTALIRTLPKPVRRNFVPAPDYARAVLDRAGPGDGRLLDVVTRQLGLLTGDPLPRDAWEPERVPDHLRITFRVTGEDGTVVASGKELAALQARLRGELRQAIAGAVPAIERTGARAWEFGTVPRRVDAAGGVTAYPALVDEGATVGLRALPTVGEQARAMWTGTRRLLLLTIGSPQRTLERLLRNDAKLALGSAGMDDCIACAVDAAIAAAGGPAWDAEGFDRLRAAVRDDLVDVAVEVGNTAARVLMRGRALELRLASVTAAPLQPAVADVRGQLSRLVYPGFVTATGRGRLADVDRYLEAVERRLEKLPSQPGRDRDLMRQVQRVEDAWAAVMAAVPAARGTAQAERVRWMIEELRVSLFAQVLGTGGQAVSEKRILRELDELRQLAP